jgi:hypothetical protein
MRQRRLVAIVVMAWAAPAGLSAQESTVGGALPPIGLPLPRIGLPLPAIGLTRPEPSPAVAPPRAPIAGRGHHPGRHRGPIFLVPVYAVPVVVQPVVVLPSAVDECAAGVCESSSERQPVRGRLHVDVEPRDAARIYVDGNFMGGSSEGGGDLELEPGVHTLEIAADGHRSVHETVLVTAGSRLVYTAALEPNPPPRREPRTPVTFYFLPGCYAGDVPPAQVHLPAGCDPKKAVSITR